MRRPSWREVDDLGFWGCARRLPGLPSIKPLVCAFRIRVAPALVELGGSALILGEEGRPFCGVRPGALGRIALISGVAALCGAVMFRGLSPALTSSTVATAAGAILAMLADTMLPRRSSTPTTGPV